MTFENWLQRFERSRKGKKALDSLNAIGDRETIGILANLILTQCFLASQYDELTDPNAQRREANKDTLGAIPEQIKAIETLRRFIAEHPAAAGWLSVSFFLGLRSNGYIYTGEPRDTKQALDETLAGYQQALEQPLFSVRCGPWEHRTQAGCLSYPKTIDFQSARANAQVNGLLFALTFIFRKWTSGAAAAYVAGRKSLYIAGETMPADGKPCYKQVALFARAALSCDMTAKRAATNVKKLLSNHPGIQLVGWPKNRET